MPLAVQSLAFIAATWLAAYLFVYLRLRPLEKRLPVETPEALQEFWNAMQRQFSTLAKVILWLCLFSLILCLELDHVRLDFMTRMNGALFILFLVGLLLVVKMGAIPLDRKFRLTSWSTRRHLITIAGIRLAWGWALWGLLAGVETSRMLAPRVMELAWRPAFSVGIMIVVFAIIAPACFMLGLRLLEARPIRNPAIEAMIEDLCRKANVKSHRILLIPERGGKLPLAAVIPGRILLGEYLVQTLTPDELRAILAHEVAHAAGGDVRKRVWAGLITAGAGMLMVGLPEPFYASMSQHSPPLYLMLSLVPLVLANSLALRAYQRQELRADGLGATLIGSPALMAGALEKLHALGYLPGKFPKEKKMTHPSLAKRLAALRAMDQETAPAANAPAAAERDTQC